MDDDPIRVIEITAENVKMLKAVRFRPDPTLQVVAGKNGAGKTSVLDALWSALAGERHGPDMPDPIRHGQDKAEVTLDLGDLTVTRTWRRGAASTLKLTSKERGVLKTPQTILDALTGNMTFDPLEFGQQKPREQRDTLLGLVDLPFDLVALDSQRQQVFDLRRDVGRDLKAATARLDGVPIPSGAVGQLPSVSDAAERLNVLHQIVSGNDQVIAQQRAAETQRSSALARADRAAAALAAAQAELDDATEDLHVASGDLERISVKVEALEQPDVDGAVATLRAAEAAQAQVAQRAERERLSVEVAAVSARHAALNAKLVELDATKERGLREAKMPIEGLAITDDGITFNGFPFSQCSGAQQLRVAMSIAMASNPRLRVIRIADGSLLDSDGMRLVEEMAAANSFQVWIERVGSADEMGVVIESGEIIADHSETSES